MLSCCSPYTLKNTQETLCFKKYSTDVLFCTSQLSSRHNPTRVTKPSSRGSSGKGSLMTCQLAALCHITWNKENVSRVSLDKLPSVSLPRWRGRKKQMMKTQASAIAFLLVLLLAGCTRNAGQTSRNAGRNSPPYVSLDRSGQE